MDVFEFDDYRELLRSSLELMPKKGFGQLSRLAAHIGVSGALISQIFSAKKNLSEDQAFAASEFLNFNEAETFYFVLLIQRERAGNHKLKALFEKKILQARRESKLVKTRITVDRELTFEQQAVYYSDWIYTAIHTLSSVPDYQSIDAVAKFLDLPRPKIIAAANWLLQQGLCIEEAGRFKIGPSSIFVAKESPLAIRHHGNWRLKAISAMAHENKSDLFFTAPFSISVNDYESIRNEIVQFIDQIAKRVKKTSPELMATINIDLFKA